MISVTEIAEKLQISKMMVYRFINNNEIKHSAKDGRTFLYDMTAFQTIKEGLKDKSVISSDNNIEITENKNEEEPLQINDNDVIIEIMRSEIEIKNKQIDELTEINKVLNVTLQQQQQLLLYEQQKNTKLLEENIENKRWWQWWK
ncbi:helix-turn-helix domain-containing protein [Vagococcus fluvialis]|uniref:helix-turn-helix domain-containing protein n=1 Tax=Vagococcus fluvialis TaxID=2738 RepID=UPI001A8EE2FA|nr:helix-turn-helix domain-containing protein [Vagococcus fluvialis]MBO0438666.1 helix-turn-helix domain-containing protein [Vagococcus fluvialis]